MAKTTTDEPKEGQRVRTTRGEPATIYMISQDRLYAVLTMEDQYMPDGGQAFRTVPLSEITLLPTLVLDRSEPPTFHTPHTDE